MYGRYMCIYSCNHQFQIICFPLFSIFLMVWVFFVVLNLINIFHAGFLGRECWLFLPSIIVCVSFWLSLDNIIVVWFFFCCCCCPNNQNSKGKKFKDNPKTHIHSVSMIRLFGLLLLLQSIPKIFAFEWSYDDQRLFYL